MPSCHVYRSSITERWCLVVRTLRTQAPAIPETIVGQSGSQRAARPSDQTAGVPLSRDESESPVDTTARRLARLRGKAGEGAR
jgi:hypothetical protein